MNDTVKEEQPNAAPPSIQERLRFLADVLNQRFGINPDSQLVREAADHIDGLELAASDLNPEPASEPASEPAKGNTTKKTSTKSKGNAK